MADITNPLPQPFLRHLRAEPTSHVMRYRRGRLVRAGAGLAFWFRPSTTAIAQIPVDDRELPFLFHARSADYQRVTVQGAITFRVGDPALLADRIDFSIDLRSGRWTAEPLEHVGGLLTQLAQQFVIDQLATRELRAILAEGVTPIRARIDGGLAAEPALAQLGLQVVAVRVADVAPTAEVEKALQQPAREEIQTRADEATFARRATAVENERAIGENELANRIELARRHEQLVAQEGSNERRRAQEAAAARKIGAEADDELERLAAQRRADTIDLVEQATLRGERERAEIQKAIPAGVLLALALQELAGQIGRVEHLTITPELLTPLLQRIGTVDDRG